jgi:hypothetical protein
MRRGEGRGEEERRRGEGGGGKGVMEHEGEGRLKARRKLLDLYASGYASFNSFILKLSPSLSL